ncbi:hypothetical protein [Microbacterium sp. UBA3486]|uniref:hypothetical protein n=1 Tax=Microbacterium TaxID=33882 RepID=UPI0025EB3021|nr:MULTISPECIES: hypothetical protein [Microbacterium]
MFSDIAGVRKALKERLEELLPNWPEWEISEFIKQPPTEYRSPIVIFEFTRFESAANGSPLGPGQVAAAIDIVLGSPKTTDDAGESDVDQLALTLINIIDSQSDIYWDSAEKQRLEKSGQWIWRIHTTVLTSSKE